MQAGPPATTSEGRGSSGGFWWPLPNVCPQTQKIDPKDFQVRQVPAPSGVPSAQLGFPGLLTRVAAAPWRPPRAST